MKRNIESDFVVLSPEKTATTESLDATLYERLGENYGGFSGHDLIACHTFEHDWPTWEIHPNGDEVVILLSGKATLLLEQEQERREIQLEQAGDYLIVPRNTWHTARISEKSKMLFVTPGEGTLNRDA